MLEKGIAALGTLQTPIGFFCVLVFVAGATFGSVFLTGSLDAWTVRIVTALAFIIFASALVSVTCLVWKCPDHLTPAPRKGTKTPKVETSA